MEELNADKAEKIAEREKLDAEIEKIDEKVEAKEAEIETLDDIDEKECDVMGYLNENYSDFVNKYNLHVKEEKKTTEWRGGVEGRELLLTERYIQSILRTRWCLGHQDIIRRIRSKGRLLWRLYSTKRRVCFTTSRRRPNTLSYRTRTENGADYEDTANLGTLGRTLRHTTLSQVRREAYRRYISRTGLLRRVPRTILTKNTSFLNLK